MSSNSQYFIQIHTTMFRNWLVFPSSGNEDMKKRLHAASPVKEPCILKDLMGVGVGCLKQNYLSEYNISVETKSKVHPVTCPEDTQRARRYSSTLSLASTLRGGGWLALHSGLFIPWIQTPYHPLYRGLGGLQCQTERVCTISPSHRDSNLGPSSP